eukprot:TRINITY_DN2458_c0_g3_i3.p1 TRINITY_DN2458_c0_g3~~TRINITY_DN2458_c0_g3_i3.p1  ORF type:complete len:763 (-),score=144.99 TRINITY_DN2458_c0_g3_i3:82-2370(-)
MKSIGSFSIPLCLLLVSLFLILSPALSHQESKSEQLRELFRGIATGFGLPFESEEFPGDLGIDVTSLISNLQSLQSYKNETKKETIKSLEATRKTLEAYYKQCLTQHPGSKSVLALVNETLSRLENPRGLVTQVQKKHLEDELKTVGKAIPRFITFAGSEFGMILRQYTPLPRSNVSTFVSGFVSALLQVQVPSEQFEDDTWQNDNNEKKLGHIASILVEKQFGSKKSSEVALMELYSLLSSLALENKAMIQNQKELSEVFNQIVPVIFLSSEKLFKVVKQLNLSDKIIETGKIFFDEDPESFGKRIGELIKVIFDTVYVPPASRLDLVAFFTGLANGQKIPDSEEWTKKKEYMQSFSDILDSLAEADLNDRAAIRKTISRLINVLEQVGKEQRERILTYDQLYNLLRTNVPLMTTNEPLFLQIVEIESLEAKFVQTASSSRVQKYAKSGAEIRNYIEQVSTMITQSYTLKGLKSLLAGVIRQYGNKNETELKEADDFTNQTILEKAIGSIEKFKNSKGQKEEVFHLALDNLLDSFLAMQSRSGWNRRWDTYHLVGEVIPHLSKNREFLRKFYSKQWDKFVEVGNVYTSDKVEAGVKLGNLLNEGYKADPPKKVTLHLVQFFLGIFGRGEFEFAFGFWSSDANRNLYSGIIGELLNNPDNYTRCEDSVLKLFTSLKNIKEKPNGGGSDYQVCAEISGIYLPFILQNEAVLLRTIKQNNIMKEFLEAANQARFDHKLSGKIISDQIINLYKLMGGPEIKKKSS